MPNKKKFNIVCSICGKKFEDPSPLRKYCSKKCSREGQRRLDRGKYVKRRRKSYKKICPVCDKKFTSFSKIKKYCSKKCAKKAQKQKSEEYYKNNTTTAFYKLRFEIFKRDKFRCFYCGRSSIEDGITLEVEHIHPRNGKRANWEKAKKKNLVASCRDCNTGKGNRVLSLPILKRINKEVERR